MHSERGACDGMWISVAISRYVGSGGGVLVWGDLGWCWLHGWWGRWGDVEWWRCVGYVDGGNGVILVFG